MQRKTPTWGFGDADFCLPTGGCILLSITLWISFQKCVNWFKLLEHCRFSLSVLLFHQLFNFSLQLSVLFCFKFQLTVYFCSLLAEKESVVPCFTWPKEHSNLCWIKIKLLESLSTLAATDLGTLRRTALPPAAGRTRIDTCAKKNFTYFFFKMTWIAFLLKLCKFIPNDLVRGLRYRSLLRLRLSLRLRNRWLLRPDLCMMMKRICAQWLN